MRIQNKLNKMKARGFTLVELMIVVAIIGVLAALAIYGVRKYLANAKTAEARTAVGRIAKDAASAWDRESMASGVLALGSTRAIARQLCVGAGATVPDAIGKVSGMKYQSSPGEWKDGAGWECLRFSMDGPQYFMYDYDSTQSSPTVGTFSAIANGDLNANGTPSTFKIDGALATADGETVVTVSPSITEIAGDE